jgi:hypothetical protein
MEVGRTSRRPLQHEDRQAEVDTHLFVSRNLATRFMYLDSGFTYDSHDRGFALYRGPNFGERGTIWERDGVWCVSFWQE